MGLQYSTPIAPRERRFPAAASSCASGRFGLVVDQDIADRRSDDLQLERARFSARRSLLLILAEEQRLAVLDENLASAAHFLAGGYARTPRRLKTTQFVVESRRMTPAVTVSPRFSGG